MAGLLFGTAGIPILSSSPSSLNGVKRVSELGLGCMEVEFVQGVNLSPAAARLIGDQARALSIRLTAHAPYYINLNAATDSIVRSSQRRLLQSAEIGALCGVESVAFHAAFYLDQPPDEVYERVRNRVREVVDRLRAAGNGVALRPELTGKPTQFGSLDEIIRLSEDVPGVLPCIDFAHHHARSGANNTYAEFAAALDVVERRLGRAAIDNLHLHVSGIRYGRRGELRHLPLGESDLRYEELLRALKDRRAGGLVICESPNLEEDALLLKGTYEALR